MHSQWARFPGNRLGIADTAALAQRGERTAP